MEAFKHYWWNAYSFFSRVMARGLVSVSAAYRRIGRTYTSNSRIHADVLAPIMTL